MKKFEIALNPDWKPEQISAFLSKIQDNKGYCPCRLDKTQDTKCPCTEFRDQNVDGECYCCLIVKVGK